MVIASEAFSTFTVAELLTGVGVSTDVMLALLVRGVPSVMLLLTRATTLRSPDDLAGSEVVCQVMTLPEMLGLPVADSRVRPAGKTSRIFGLVAASPPTFW